MKLPAWTIAGEHRAELRVERTCATVIRYTPGDEYGGPLDGRWYASVELPLGTAKGFDGEPEPTSKPIGNGYPTREAAQAAVEQWLNHPGVVAPILEAGSCVQ